MIYGAFDGSKLFSCPAQTAANKARARVGGGESSRREYKLFIFIFKVRATSESSQLIRSQPGGFNKT
jgi:hypothetical protein